MKVMTGIAALGAALLASGIAFAAEPPDLVGTWKALPGTYASVRLGGDNDYHPEFSSPDFGKPDEAWSIVVETQQGRAFSGKAVSPKGKSEAIVGVVSSDGKRLTMAANVAGLFGTIDGKQIEFCYQDQEGDRAGVACYVAERQ